MITATLNSKPLYLPRTFSFEHVRQGQMPVKNEISGDYVPEISLPDVPINRELLGHPQRFSIAGYAAREFPGFQLRVNGSLKIAGTLVVREYSKGAFQCYVIGLVGELGKRQREKSIRKFATMQQKVLFNRKASYDPATDLYCTPEIRNNNFFGNFGRSATVNINGEPVETTTMNKWFYQTTGFVVNKNEATGVMRPISSFDPRIINQNVAITVISPYMFLFRTIELLLAEEGYVLFRNDLTENNDLKNIIIYNNFDITETTYLTLGEYADANNVYLHRRVNRSRIRNLVRMMGSRVKFANLLPEMNLNELLLSMQNLFNVIVSVDNFSRMYFVDRESIFETPPQDLDKYFVGEWGIGEKKNIAIRFKIEKDDTDEATSENDFDPAERLGDFIEPVKTIEDLPGSDENGEPSVEIGTLCLVKSTGNVYEFQIYNDDEFADIQGFSEVTLGWVVVGNITSYEYFNLSAGLEIEDIESSFGTLVEDGDMPFTSQPGSGESKFEFQKAFKGRLLFYNGGAQCSNQTDNYSMSFRGPNGFVAKRWPKTAEWWCHRQPVNCTMRLPESVLNTFDINQKKRTRHGEFIIEKMVTKYTHDGTGETQIEGYKV